MVAAFNDESGFTSAGCLIHSMQLVISKEVIEFPSVKSALDKARKICTHANKSTIFCAELRRQQRLQIGNLFNSYSLLMEEFVKLNLTFPHRWQRKSANSRCGDQVEFHL